MMTRGKKRRYIVDEREDKKSLVLFLIGSLGFELEADRVARVSKNILQSDQIVEGFLTLGFLLAEEPD